MSSIVNYDTNNIRVVRDDNNVNFYSKENLTVSGLNGNVVITDGTNTVEQLPFTQITSPSYPTLDQYIVAVRGYIDEYIRVIDIGNAYEVDAFARKRMSSPQTIFDSKQVNDKQPLFWDDQQTSGSGTSSTYNTNQASTTIAITGGVAGKRVRQTFRRFNYQPGKSQLVYITGKFGDNSPISVGIRTFTSGVAVDNIKTQSEWNIDKMNGLGVSRKKINNSKNLIFFFDYEWLGVGTVAMGIIINRTPYYVHWFNHSNETDVVYMSTPNLPVRYEIETNGSTITKRAGLFDDKNGIFFEQPNCTSTSFVHICSTVISEGGAQTTGFPFGIDRGVTPLVTLNNTNFYPLFALRLKSNYLGSSIILKDFSIICSSTSVFNYRLILNPTVTGTALSFTSITNGSIEAQVNTTNATTVSGGTVIASGTSQQTNDSSANGNLNSDFYLGSTIAGVSDILVLAVQRATGTTETFYGSLNWVDQQ